MEINEARQELDLCNSYTRLPTLLDIYGRCVVEDEAWLQLCGEYWSICDNISGYIEDLLDTPLADVLSDPSLQSWLMDDAEASSFSTLPEEFEIWRGCRDINKNGLCWSLDPTIAASFPALQRYGGASRPLLVRARVRKSEVAALKLSRDEAEIITWRARQISVRHL